MKTKTDDQIHAAIKELLKQVHQINNLIDKDVPCEEVLVQIHRAKQDIHGVGQMVLERHLNACVQNGVKTKDLEKTVESFKKAVEYFSRM